MAPQYEKMATWVRSELDPFIEKNVLTIAPPHAILVYVAAEFPQNNTARRLYYAVESKHPRKEYYISTPAMSSVKNRMVSVLKDEDLRQFTNLSSVIIDKFKEQPSPLFIAKKVFTHEWAGTEKDQKLLISLFLSANKYYPWK